MSNAPDSSNCPTGLHLSSVTGLDPVVTVPAAFPFLTPSSSPHALGQFGPYPVKRFLGAGAAGFVFEAFDKDLGRAVVLKILRPELAATPDHRRRFLREAKAAAAIQSDHTVPIYAVGEQAGLPFLEMPLLAGESLQTRLRRGQPRPLEEALEVGRQTALGLADAHAVGLIHRDIKPANLWVEMTSAGGVRRVRLLDFGLARPPQKVQSATELGGVLGTPHYMSPEQAQGGALDPRSDLFSLGVTLYLLLTGRLPFVGNTVAATLVTLATHPHVPVNYLNSAVPSAVSDLIDQLLAKRPHDRPQSAMAVADELERSLRVLGLELSAQGGVPAASTPMNLTAHTSKRPPGTAAILDLPTFVAEATPHPPAAGFCRRCLPWVAAGVCAAVAVALAVLRPAGTTAPPPVLPIPVGVLHSQSGTMQFSENPVIDATLLALDEVNAAGGVNGRPLAPVLADGKSDPDVFAAEAERLLTREKAAVLFGCWTSASRKAVRPVVERHAGLLFYPVQYEGLEQSPAVVYLGHAPNQQLLPAVDFLVKERKAKRIYLVGSDYVFPRSANRIIRDHIESTHRGVAEVAGEEYRPLGEGDWAKVITDIVQTRPDAVLNTINGCSAIAFYRDLRAKEDLLGVPHTRILSVSVTANELTALPLGTTANDYLAGTIFDLPHEPDPFRDRFRTRYGAERPTTDMMSAAYHGVHLWAAAANAAGGTDPAAVKPHLGGRTFTGPAGPCTLDPDTFHLWQPVRIAQVKPDGGLRVVFAVDGGRPVRPEPFPRTRPPAEWEQFLQELHIEYGGKWLAPPGR